MVELPFQITFDLDFSDKIPEKKILSKLDNLFLSVKPKPAINLIFKQVDRYLYNFILNISRQYAYNIIAIDPILNDILINLVKKITINLKITNNKYDLSELNSINYNLILPFRNNLHEYIRSVNYNNVRKITILHNKNSCSYSDFKNQLKLINKDDDICKKCYLLPYLEEYEQEKYYSDGAIRPFLTCAAPWINPVIDSSGKIKLPCFCSNDSITNVDFFELWDNNDLNCLRNKLITFKQFYKCKYCEKFYKENFFIVEEAKLKYKDKEFIFDNILNPVKSAPAIGIVSDGKICEPVPLYSEIEIQKLYNERKLLLLLK